MAHAPKKFVIKPSASLNSDINVTPLVDVVLVLLIIFMVLTPLLEKDIAVRVPDTEKVDIPEEVPKDQLMVRVLKNGEIKFNTGQSETTIQREALVAKLKEYLDLRRRVEDKVVFVMAEEGANYGGVVGVLDMTRQAGAQVLGMMTKGPDEEEGKGQPAPPPQ